MYKRTLKSKIKEMESNEPNQCELKNHFVLFIVFPHLEMKVQFLSSLDKMVRIANNHQMLEDAR